MTKMEMSQFIAGKCKIIERFGILLEYCIFYLCCEIIFCFEAVYNRVTVKINNEHLNIYIQ